MTDFSSSQFFEDNGYIHLKSVLTTEQIDNMISALNQTKKSRKRFYSQNTHQWLKPKSDEYNHLINSIQDFTQIKSMPYLSKAGLDILLSSEINSCLNLVRPATWIMYQNMLFDKSAETVDHIDSWYLDTNPAGDLVGAWIALEDIHTECGPFRVYPGSHKTIYPSDFNKIHYKDHNSFLKYCLDNKYPYKPKDILASKGDVIIWHSHLIHGASSITDRSFSRKSLTAHYYPMGSCLMTTNFKDTGLHSLDYLTKKLKLIRHQLKSIKTYRSSPILMRDSTFLYWLRMSKLLSYYMLRPFGKLQNPVMQMNRSNYE